MKRVVVTGMGAVTPIGNTVPAFWEGLKNGKNGIGMITRFDAADQKVKVAGEVKDFDPLQYIEKSQVRKMDLFTQYAMAAAAQAMQDSGLKSGENIEAERLGVYVGSGCGGINTISDQCFKFFESGPRHVSPFLIPMMIGNIAGGNIAIRYDAEGPNLPVVTACATSTNAIGEAFRAVRYGYADAIIAGGAEAAVNPVGVAGFANCKALTTCEDPEQACTPFDKRRSGFVMGEGAGIVVLEELEHAKARGAKIYAELVGYGCTADAFHITSPAEDGSGAAKAMEYAIRDAGIAKEEVTYVNAHGTGTHHNDLFETRALHLCFGDHAKNLKINSTKSMVGHLLGAAGAVEFIACVKELQEGFLHATVGYRVPDEECDLDYCKEPVTGEVRYALTNSLGFGGHNATLLLKRYEG